MRVVPILNLREDYLTGFSFCFPRPAVDQLTFQRGEETVCHGVVICIAGRAHGGFDAHLFASFTKCRAGALTALILIRNIRKYNEQTIPNQ